VARTAHTLLLGDLETCKLSEVEWRDSNESERFIFDNEGVCIIYYNGELTLIMYGRNAVLGVCRTEHLHPTLISVVAQDGKVPDGRGGVEIKTIMGRFAYLVDLQTVRITDLLTPNNAMLATINHDSKIDWLELNQRGTHLLFRDKKRHLNLYNIQQQERVTLLNYAGYVQWVPQSDVVVAQSRSNLCVWYSINTPDRVSMFPIRGELTDIERVNNRTEVIVNEGINTVSYALDEQLIEALSLRDALGEGNLERAVRVLEPLELNAETEAQWMELGELALKQSQIVIAERCRAALGDMPKTRFLHKVVKMAQKAQQEQGGNGYESYGVRAALARLDRQVVCVSGKATSLAPFLYTSRAAFLPVQPKWSCPATCPWTLRW
jgi:intraflagellar transport protein 172